MGTSTGKRLLLLTLGIGLLVPTASADAMLMFSARVAVVDGGTFDACATDQNFDCAWGAPFFDTDPAPNRLAFGAPSAALLGGVQVSAAQNISNTSTGTPGNLLDFLQSSSVSVTNTNTTPVTILVAVSNTDYAGPVFRAFTEGGATFENAIGASIAMTWCDDPDNRQGAFTPSGCPGNVIDSFASGLVTQATQSFTHNGGPFPVSDPGLFGMTLTFTLTLPGWGGGATPQPSLISRSQGESKEQLVTAAPEPGTMLLVGSMLGVMAWRWRRA